MAKRARTAKSVKSSGPVELNPGTSAGSLWNVHRTGMETLSVHADYLDVTDSGALIFMIGRPEAPPLVVIAAHQYLYCVKVR